jgi:ABC-type nitrate/sulfonate/bicarbonate transport system ATPase subunit
VPAHFGLETPVELAEAMHRGRIRARRVLELPPVVFAEAEHDQVAARSSTGFSAEIVAMARVALERLELAGEPAEVLARRGSPPDGQRPPEQLGRDRAAADRPQGLGHGAELAADRRRGTARPGRDQRVARGSAAAAARAGGRWSKRSEVRAVADVRFSQATKLYAGSDTPAVDALDLHIEDGEFMVMVGPSGSGKTTALRMLAGLEEVDDGAILIGGRDVTYLPPKKRDIAMVFQNYALYPYLTVSQNIAFPLKMAKVKKAERERRAREVAARLGLEAYFDRKPAQLSGGERQRVAMGRAIIRQPSVFLMDEPLSNLDAKLRVQMRADIAALQRDLGITTVYVTHDQPRR